MKQLLEIQIHFLINHDQKGDWRHSSTLGRGQRTAGGSKKAVLSSECHKIGARSMSDSTVASG